MDTPPMPMNAPATRVPAGADQVALADTEMMPAQMSMQPSTPPRPPLASLANMSTKGPAPALPAMTTGLVSTAAVWLGLALFVAAVAYPMSDFARASLTLIGSSLVAIVVAFGLSSRPEYA